MGAYLSSPIVTKDTVSGKTEHFHFGISSHQGWRKTQEDAHIAEPISDEHFLFGVFDGHGGAEVAKFCAAYLPHELKSHENFQKGDHEASLVSVFHRMDELLITPKGREDLEAFRPKNEGSEGNPQDDALSVIRKYMAMQNQAEKSEVDGQPNILDDEKYLAGCTAIVALVTKDIVYVANAGDSRAILSRGKVAIPLSEDHKPSQIEEKERIVAAGGFVSEIGGIPRVNGNLSLSRAIGDLKYKQNPDLERHAQIITAEPDVTKIDLMPSDEFIVLACDGIWDVMDNQEVVDFVHERLGQNKAPDQVASELLDRCVASDPRESRGKGCDNMTCCIVVLNRKENLQNGHEIN